MPGSYADHKVVAGLGLVTGLQIADIGECGELFEGVRGVARDGVQQESDMIAEVVAVQYRPAEPPGRVLQNR